MTTIVTAADLAHDAQEFLRFKRAMASGISAPSSFSTASYVLSRSNGANTASWRSTMQ